MAKIFEGRRECPGNPRLNASVHDEVVLSVAEDRAEEAAEWVRKHMADAEREAVVDPESPIVIECGDQGQLGLNTPLLIHSLS